MPGVQIIANLHGPRQRPGMVEAACPSVAPCLILCVEHECVGATLATFQRESRRWYEWRHQAGVCRTDNIENPQINLGQRSGEFEPVRGRWTTQGLFAPCSRLTNPLSAFQWVGAKH